jgi:XTP/dITP diphosphohydrolase
LRCNGLLSPNREGAGTEDARPLASHTHNVLLIATGNTHKFAEISAFLEGVPWKLLSLRDFPACDPPQETGATFEANAVIKATSYAARFEVSCVADDSGIVVDALDGAPGVHSARYAGAACTDADNNAKLLDDLRRVPDAERTARFVCCCALVVPGSPPRVETGVVEGRIALACRGPHGFGYDPLFIPNGHAKTFGELGPEIKSAISHRARAFAKMRAYLETW